MAYIYVYMIHRKCNLPDNHSFFLFGPRATGKSTLLDFWRQDKSVLFIDLLNPTEESRYATKPERLLEDWSVNKAEWIVIDEVQKNTALLNVAQQAIVKHKIKFALTGSSARKLRRGAGNLLGGRAFEFHLHPFTTEELQNKIDLIDILKWGTLPEVLPLNTEEKHVNFIPMFQRI